MYVKIFGGGGVGCIGIGGGGGEGGGVLMPACDELLKAPEKWRIAVTKVGMVVDKG